MGGTIGFIGNNEGLMPYRWVWLTADEQVAYDRKSNIGGETQNVNVGTSS